MILGTLVISTIAIFADLVLKQAADTKNIYLLMVGMLMYVADAYMWYVVYQSAKFSTVGIVYSIFTILLSILIGVSIFKDKLGVMEIVGIVLGVISVVFLSRFES